MAGGSSCTPRSPWGGRGGGGGDGGGRGWASGGEGEGCVGG